MKAVELLKISREILKMVSENGIHLEDYKYVQAYEEFLVMRSNRVKYHAAIRMLSEDYHIGERTLERVFERLKREC